MSRLKRWITVKIIELYININFIFILFILEISDADDCNAFLKEAITMKDFHHKNVLTLIGVCFDCEGFPMVVLPFMSKGDLWSYIRNENNHPTVKDLL